MPSASRSIQKAGSRRVSASVPQRKAKAASKPVRRRAAPATRVAILGGGRGGRALLEIFAQDPLARIVGLAEIKPRTLGTRLARQLGVPVTQDYR
ncbi:MAG: hypothetical protein F4X63_04650, partial [Nitrospira sp. SB0662_bin_26]|nr:hypothetical protein [Nitrospira sp. SB0662_bin_26]